MTTTDMLLNAQQGFCATEESTATPVVYTQKGATVCADPTNAIVLDSKAIHGSACESISFEVSNEGDTRWLIWGTRGMPGLDPLYAGDPFVGANYADSAAFLVNTLPNGAAFQGFNYRCANTGYLMKSIVLRNIPVASPLVTAPLKAVEYGCDPENICVTKKVSPTCSPCANNNQVFTQSEYRLGLQPIDHLHAVGLLIPAGTELLPFTVNVEVNIVAIASAKAYVPCGSKVAVAKQIIQVNQA